MKFAADHNFREAILTQLERRRHINVVRLRDVGLATAPDADVLAWCAREGFVLLSHDVNTIPATAYERVVHGLSMPGVVIVPLSLPIGAALSDLDAVIAADDADLADAVLFLPL